MIEIVISINEALMMHKLAELARKAGLGNAFHKWLFLPNSLSFHAYAIACNNRFRDACKNISSCFTASAARLTGLFHSTCLNKLRSAVCTFGSIT